MIEAAAWTVAVAAGAALLWAVIIIRIALDPHGD